MTGTIDITCTVPAPTLAQARAWLVRTGWTVNAGPLGPVRNAERWSHPKHGSTWVPREEPDDWLTYVSNWIANRAWQIDATPEAVYREIMGPVRVSSVRSTRGLHEAVTYDALGRTSLGFYASRESAPQGGDVSIEEYEVQP